ncbi:MAG: isoprenyl transferase [Acidobacteriota bacterium]|nr:isoprenyl transferase [Acidobacteriota bacterium]MDH3523243.1 isoprenyl transferase [Acidobacteriota bacterium]
MRRLDLERLPRHVAIIMDGNGRWARARGLPRVHGHRAGVEAVRDTVEAAARLELDVLTLYAFSVENWKRPRYEVWALMNLLKEYLRRELPTLIENGIRFSPLGRWRELDPSVVAALETALDATRDCSGMQLNIAVNYSGRCEIVDACRQIVSDWASGKGTDIDEETMGRYLYTAGQADPDLMIRTSGESRISNFMLWQCAYSEFDFVDTLWPDFRRRHLYEAILDYQRRERRYGAVSDPSRDRESEASARAERASEVD